jgi:XTP/dITP diphosphohydrolase
MDKYNLIVATGNAGKLREIKEIFSGLPFDISSLRDHWNPLPSIPETGATFLENARIKAMWVFDKTGVWSLADDSGLEVDCLGGEPGVRSARYAGEGATDGAKIEKLLRSVDRCASVPRAARFRCAVVMALAAGDEIACEGSCEGSITDKPRGTDGFGYDPVFVPAGYSKTFAELDSAVKNSISHRGKALAALRRMMDERFGKNSGRD